MSSFIEFPLAFLLSPLGQSVQAVTNLFTGMRLSQFLVGSYLEVSVANAKLRFLPNIPLLNLSVDWRHCFSIYPYETCPGFITLLSTQPFSTFFLPNS